MAAASGLASALGAAAAGVGLAFFAANVPGVGSALAGAAAAGVAGVAGTAAGTAALGITAGATTAGATGGGVYACSLRLQPNSATVTSITINTNFFMSDLLTFLCNRLR